MIVRVRQLFLWDIDGTLVRRAGPQHGQVLVEAIRSVVGVETTMAGVPVHGMLDRDIIRCMLSAAGQAEGVIARAMPEIVQVAQELYPALCPADLRDKLCPGVPQVLGDLAAAGLPMALVTGNLTRIGWMKVERAGLRDYFAAGAFAEMGETRAELARIACGLMGATAETEVTLIGDSPSDVRAAQANGFRSLAVATGVTSYEELRALRPDVLLRDFTRTATLRRA